jgi:hypothetical protein
MKIKLNHKQIARISRELKESDRKSFDTDDVAGVFNMLQYWSKSVGGGKTKIRSVTDLLDGYLCRVNEEFKDVMKQYLKQARMRVREEYEEERHRIEMEASAQAYDRLIEEAEKKSRPKGSR